MAKKIRLTQEEEVIRILKREGFREIPSTELCQEPYLTLMRQPDCFEKPEERRAKSTELSG